MNIRAFVVTSLLALALVFLAATGFSQSQDQPLNPAETAVAQAQITGEWNLAYCGEPHSPEHKGLPDWFNLTVSDDYLQSDNEGFFDQTVKGISGIGSDSPKTDYTVRGKYRFTGATHNVNNSGLGYDSLTFSNPFTKDGVDYLNLLVVLLTPTGKVMGGYFSGVPMNGEGVGTAYLVFGQRGTKDTLEAFAGTAETLCTAVHHVPSATDNEKAAPVREWVGIGR